MGDLHIGCRFDRFEIVAGPVTNRPNFGQPPKTWWQVRCICCGDECGTTESRIRSGRYDCDKCRSLINLARRSARVRHEDRHLRTLAHRAVQEAVERGSLVRPAACSQCGDVAEIEAHHDDYAKPLDVRWLCTTCHGFHHALERAARVADQLIQRGAHPDLVASVRGAA